MFKQRELYLEGLRGGEQSDLKTMLSLETIPKDFFGRKVKTTPDIMVRFLSKSIENARDGLDLNDE